MFNSIGPPTLPQLLTELFEVVEWYEFGIHLGVPVSDLEEIKCENDKVRERRREMLSTWLRRSLEPTWVTIVNALSTIGRRNLAHKMALKYGILHQTSIYYSSIHIVYIQASDGHTIL